MEYPKEKLIFLDTETTGLSYLSDRIIQLSCVKIAHLDYDGFWMKSFKTFDQLINPGNIKISHSAFKIHGISDAVLQDKPLFKDVYDDFLSFIADHTVVAHNAKFDINFLNNELKQINKEELRNDVIDSVSIARKLYPRQSVSLDMLMKRFNMPSRGNHSALEDAIILARVYALMVNQSYNLGIIDNFEETENGFSEYKMYEGLIDIVT